MNINKTSLFSNRQYQMQHFKSNNQIKNRNHLKFIIKWLFKTIKIHFESEYTRQRTSDLF
jgi:hypothetical protein